MQTFLLDLHLITIENKFLIEMLLMSIGSCSGAWFLSSELKNSRRVK